MPNIKKTKLILVLIFLIFSITCIFLIRKYNITEVESYSFAERYNDSTVELETLDRGLPFKFLFANAVKSQFSFNINLEQHPAKGIRSLWIYAGQADNHGQITVEYEGKLIGVVDNQVIANNLAPVPKLSYVGDLNISGRDVILKIIGANKKLDRHYSELGLVVLAPQGMTEEKVLNILNGRSGTSATDVGMLLAILIAAYSMLAMLNKENNLNQKATRGNDVLAACVLATVCCFTYFSSAGFSPPPLLNGYVSERKGIERLIDSGFRNVASEINRLQRGFLPNRQQNDEVPERLQLSSGSFETDIYRLNQDASFNKVSTEVFSGKMAEVQLMPVEQFGSLAFWILIFILISLLLDRFVSLWWSAGMALGLISTLSILVSIRLSEGWDEFFLNLRHAYMLLHNGVYSINAKSMVEASVDLIPLLLTALLGWFGIELADAFIFISLLGNISVVMFSYLLVLKLNKDRTWALIAAFLIGLYPNVVWVGASGFSAVLFCGWILAAIYFSIFTDRRLIGLIILSTLTLVRTEGVLFAALLMAYLYVFKPLSDIVRTGIWKSAVKRALLDGAIVASPFVCSLTIRKVFFGYAIPNPITFKNTSFDSSFFANGIERFTQMISNHDLHLMVVLTAFLLFSNFIAWKKDTKLEAWRIEIRKLIALNIVIFLFILPYYMGGGDWFSVRWNRYGLPFNLILNLTFVVLLYGAFFIGLKRWVSGAGLLVFGFAIIVGYQKSAQFRQDNFIYSTLPTVIHPFGGRWQRVDNLASLGQFLGNVLPADAVVSSPEEATIMYFSKREMLGLLGVSNPEMTSMPFQPLNPGDILHRRRGYASVFKSRPDVIALWDPVVVGDFGYNSSLDEKIKNVLQNEMFNSGMVNVAYYRIGSFSALEKMGYRHVSISYSDRIFSLFIGERVYEDFVKNIQAKGFKYFGSKSISYSVNPELSKKYVPATKEIMTCLLGVVNENSCPSRFVVQSK